MESQLTFTDKLVNIFVSPSEVFEDVTTTESKSSNYWIPLLFTIIAGIIFNFVVFSDTAIQSQMDDITHSQIMQAVENGKMTPEQAEIAIEKNPAKPGSRMFFIIGSIGIMFIMFLTLFGVSFVVWLCGKIFFKSAATYGKYCETVGVSMYILMTGTLLTMVTILLQGSLYSTPSLGIFVNDYDTKNKYHLIYSAFDLSSFWFMSVLSIGLSKLYATTYSKALTTILILWALYVASKLFLSFSFAV